MATCAFVLCGLETARLWRRINSSACFACFPRPGRIAFQDFHCRDFAENVSHMRCLRRPASLRVKTPTHFGSGAGGLDEVVIRAWTSISTSLFIEDLSAVGSWELYDGLGAL